LLEVADALGRMAAPQPRLVLGGRAFNEDRALRAQFPAALWATTARELVAALERS
jgi:hypothetical protein